LNLSFQLPLGTLPLRLREPTLPRFIRVFEERVRFCIYDFPAVLAGVVLNKASSFIERQIIIVEIDLTVAN